MTEALGAVARAGLSASVLIALILVIRKAVRLSARSRYALWLPVLVRLLVPGYLWSVSLPEAPRPAVTAVASVVQETGAGGVAEEALFMERPVDPAQVLAWIWLAGVVVMAAGTVIQAARLRFRLREAVWAGGRVYVTDRFDVPFALGVMRPRIYLPCGLEGEERELIIRHEAAHHRRWDPLTGILARTALCLHWFNPLVWAAYYLSRRDMESACDETVIAGCSDRQRRDYARALLRFAERRAPGEASAFSCGNASERIRLIMTYTKTKKKTLVAGVLMVALAAAGCGAVAPAKEVTGFGAVSADAGIEEIVPQEENYAGLMKEYEGAGIEVRDDGLYYKNQLIRTLTDAVAPSIIRFQHFNELGTVDVDVVREETKLPDGSTELGGPIARLEASAPSAADTRREESPQITGILTENGTPASADGIAQHEEGAYEITQAHADNYASISEDSIAQHEEGTSEVTEAYAGNYAAISEDSERTTTMEAVAAERRADDGEAFRLLDQLAPYGITYRSSGDNGIDVFWNGEPLSGLLDDGPLETTFYGYQQNGDAPLGVVVRSADGKIVGVASASDYNTYAKNQAG